MSPYPNSCTADIKIRTLPNADMTISILPHKSFSCLLSVGLFSCMDVGVPLLIPVTSISPRDIVFIDEGFGFFGGRGLVVVVVMMR